MLGSASFLFHDFSNKFILHIQELVATERKNGNMLLGM